MINILRYKDNSDSSFSNEDTLKTFSEIMTQVFPDFPTKRDYNTTINGVEFTRITTGGFYPRLTGISIESGSYGNKLRRRVMITKDNTIDDDAIRTKYNEAKLHAEKDAVLRKAAQDKYARVQNAYDKFMDELGITRYDGRGVFSETETTVKLDGRVNWVQLQNISAVLDRDIELSIEVSVPYEKAKEVYEILHPADNKVGEDKDG
jgi:hypothetical protein